MSLVQSVKITIRCNDYAGKKIRSLPLIFENSFYAKIEPQCQMNKDIDARRDALTQMT